MIPSNQIIPQRARFDCGIAALATLQGWSYERARDVLGHQVTDVGACLLPMVVPLLKEGIAGTYLMAREHPDIEPQLADRQTIRKLPTSAEIHEMLTGRRAIVVIEGGGTDGLSGRGRGHAIAWDGSRAIECGSTGEIERAPSEISFEDWPLREALILSDTKAEARPATVEVRPATEIDGADREALAALFERHERVILGFSGGKESIALAHMLEPWRDRVTLAWVNTGVMAPHMLAFVHGYRDQGWALEELQSPNVLEYWQTTGIPAEVFPQANVTGQASPRLQPWASCCHAIRQEPLNVFLREQTGPVAFINGQRRDDPGGATVSGLSSQLPPTVEVVHPLAGWSEADVFAYIERHGLTLPPQYAQGYGDSIECTICPAPMKPERMRYLTRHHPEVVPFVHQNMATAVQASQEAMNRMGAALLPCFEDQA